ncbi:phage integrase central domain-containing protein, partial [Bacillus sp. D-CC]
YKSTGRWGTETAERALKNMEEYVFPKLGKKPIDAIKPKELIQHIAEYVDDQCRKLI